MKVKLVPIDSVYLFEENPREIDKEQFEKLKNSIKEFGFVEPIVVNLRNDKSFTDSERKPTIVGGNMRYRAAKELGFKEIDIVEIDIDKNREKILNIALNRISGKWDIEKLEKMIFELSNEDLNLDLDLTGLEDWELKLYNPGEQSDEDFEELMKGMPEYEHKDLSSFRRLIVHFRNEEDINEFSKLVNQKITEKTKYIWYPELKREDLKSEKYIDKNE